MGIIYQKPRWVYIYKQNIDEYALFNALSLKVLYCDEEVINLINSPLYIGNLENSSSKKIFKTLIDNNFLIENENLKYEAEFFEKSRQKLIEHKTEVTGYFGRIRALRLVLTNKCNLKCGYCFVKNDVKDNNKDMSREVLSKALNLVVSLNREKDIEIHFFGGEPLLKFDLIRETVSYINELIIKGELNKVYYAITTNGTLITPEISKFFKENDFEVSVSIDGWKEINDLYRKDKNGNGTFDRVKHSIDILQKDQNRIGLLLTPYFHNVDQISAIWEYFVNDWHCTGMAINSPQPGIKGWEISGEKLANELYKCKKIAQKADVVFESLGDRVVDALNTRVPQILACNTFSNTTGMLVSPEGLVSPCIVNWGIKEILQPLDTFNITPEFSQWKNYQISVSNDCFNCPAINICGGVCALEGYYLEKTGKRDLERCNFFKQYLSLAIWDD